MSQPSSISLGAAVRAEIRANLKLALPLIAAQLAGVGMGAIDTVFAGRLGAQALAAVAVGVNFNVIFFVVFMGLFMACSPVVAHMVGAGRPQADIGAFIRKARRFAWIGGAVWVILLNLSAAPALRQLHLDPQTTDLAITFVRALSGSAFGLSLWFTLRFSAEGLGQVRPILYAGLVGLCCNALLDWLLLFGHFGLPRLGAPGCGVATTVSSLAMAGVLQWQFSHRRGLREVMRASALGAGCAEGVPEILRIGTPIGLILLAEAGLFVAAAMLMAQFGDTTVAAYQVAINFASMVFMIPVGVALATTVRVGHAAGAGEYRAARFRGFVGMGLGLSNAASNSLIMALFGGVIAGFYTEDAGIAAEATYFMLLAAAFQFFDGLQVTASGALRGAGNTHAGLIVQLIGYWVVGIPVGLLLAYRAHLGAVGLWAGLCVALMIAGIALLITWSRAARDLDRTTPETV